MIRLPFARSLVVTLLIVVMCACGDDQPATDDTGQATQARQLNIPEGDTLTQEDRLGPVLATLSLTPDKPRLGDRVKLVLEVEAEPGVDVRMPTFGDALGRFDIVAHVPRQRLRPDGGSVATQEYVLDLPMSGNLTIPAFLIEFIDRRDDPDADDPKELLTSPLAFTVDSVLADGDTELRPARPALDPQAPIIAAQERERAWWPWLVGGLLALGSLVAAVLWWQRQRLRQVQANAYDVAWTALQDLMTEGLPDVESADDWYVRLTDIVRRYLEDRYALRAPELTTEEFLREASQARFLSTAHRQLLGDLLANADRVKFARHVPSDDESKQALAAAERFLIEQREAEETPADVANPRAEAA